MAESTQYDATPTELVMRRFFKALQDANFMAMELWADHPRFDHGKTSLKKLDTLVGTKTLSMDVIEWLLQRAREEGLSDIWRPGRETRYRSNHNNWRGHVCDWGREWLQVKPYPNDPAQVRCLKLMFNLGWLYVPFDSWSSTAAGKEFLLEVVSPARVLNFAMAEGRRYINSRMVSTKPNDDLIDLLLERKLVDVSLCGEELVRDFKKEDDPVAQQRVLRLLAARDRSKPMPQAFTEYIQQVITGYKEYQRVAKCLPQLLGAKSGL